MRVEPEALDYFCKGCDGVRIHVLSEALRYHCGVCDRSVSAVEVAANYSTRESDDPEVLIIVDPSANRMRQLTESTFDGIMEDDNAN